MAAVASLKNSEDSAAKPAVLIVDDDPDIVEALTASVEAEGFEARTASDGRSALDLLSKGLTPRLILLDLMMPSMDGWQLRSALRSPRWSKIPVVVITAGHTAPYDVEGVLLKPIGIEKLRWALRLAR